MNKNIVILGAIALAAIGGLVFYMTQSQGVVPPVDNYVAPTSTDNGQTTPVSPEAALEGGIPVAVTNSRADTTDTTVVVTGSVTPNGDFTSYWYEYGVSPDFSNKMGIPSQPIGSGFASISAPGYITGLVKDTTYYFRLVAENQYGRVMGEQYSFKTSHGNPPPTGSLPRAVTLAATGVSKTSATLNGEVTPNQAVTQYWFEYGKTTNLGMTTALKSVGDGIGNVSASITLNNLDPATTYYFRLDAQNKFGTVISSVLDFKTAGPNASPKDK